MNEQKERAFALHLLSDTLAPMLLRAAPSPGSPYTRPLFHSIGSAIAWRRITPLLQRLVFANTHSQLPTML